MKNIDHDSHVWGKVCIQSTSLQHATTTIHAEITRTQTIGPRKTAIHGPSWTAPFATRPVESPPSTGGRPGASSWTLGARVRREVPESSVLAACIEEV